MKIRTKLKFIQTIDYYLGIPLCFILTITASIASLFQRRRMRQKPTKILFIKLTEMGAIVLAYPLINEIKKRYPEAQLHFLTFEKNTEVFELMRDLFRPENIHSISDRNLTSFLSDTCKVVSLLKKQGFDIVIDLEFFSRLSAVISFITGATKRVGFYPYSLEGLYRGELITHKIQYNPLLHISEMYFSLTQDLDRESKTTPESQLSVNLQDLIFPSWRSTPAMIADLQNKLQSDGIKLNQKIFLVNPGEGAIPLREWPLINFIEVCQKILENPQNQIILVGEKSTIGKDHQLWSALHSPRCVNWTGKTNLAELLTLFELAQYLIINDCGLGHLASTTPIKQIILFGPESPKVFAPKGRGEQYILYSNLTCSPCLSILNHRQSFCKNNICLKAISPNSVINLHFFSK